MCAHVEGQCAVSIYSLFADSHQVAAKCKHCHHQPKYRETVDVKNSHLNLKVTDSIGNCPCGLYFMWYFICYLYLLLTLNNNSALILCKSKVVYILVITLKPGLTYRVSQRNLTHLDFVLSIFMCKSLSFETPFKTILELMSLALKLVLIHCWR